jgi:hypothetical protein
MLCDLAIRREPDPVHPQLAVGGPPVTRQMSGYATTQPLRASVNNCWWDNVKIQATVACSQVSLQQFYIPLNREKLL